MRTAEEAACEEALRLLATHLDGELDATAHARVERHLARCLTCCSRAEFEGLLRSRMAELGESPVRDGLSERVQRLISTFAVTDGD